MKWTVIEDLKLEDADYIEAARRFRDWRAKDKVAPRSKIDLRVAEYYNKTIEEYCNDRINIPRYIHATKESVESVLGAHNNGRDFGSTDHFITVVSYLDVYWRVMAEHSLLDGREEEDDRYWELYEKQWAEGFTYTEPDDGSAFERCQNFKAYELVALYADEITWPKFYRDYRNGGLSSAEP